MPERPQRACAVELGGFIEARRETQKVLAQQEGAEGRREIRHDEAGPAVEPAEISDQAIDRDHGELVRDHHGAEHEREQEVASREAPAREGIGGEQGEQQLARDAQEGRGDAVAEIGEEGRLDEHGAEIRECRIERPRHGAEGFARPLEGGPEDHEHRGEDSARPSARRRICAPARAAGGKGSIAIRDSGRAARARRISAR
jgi:hypothetical protein